LHCVFGAIVLSLWLLMVLATTYVNAQDVVVTALDSSVDCLCDCTGRLVAISRNSSAVVAIVVLVRS
jgi:hypothetical protein